MNILFLAPQPFYQDRGTPIAVRALLGRLSERGEHIDLLTYHIGEDLDINGVTIHRTPRIRFIRAIRPGFSLRKLVCDLLLALKALRFARKGKYQLVYAVEEAAYIALFVKALFRLPYIYDMDSSLSQQLIDKFAFLGGFKPVFNWLQGLVIDHALAVVPVCDALVQTVNEYHPRHVTALYDAPMLSEDVLEQVDNLREQLSLIGCVVMYVGNLEAYQGIDLLLESFAVAAQKNTSLHLVIIGGTPEDIEKYRNKARALHIGQSVHFLGAKPVQQLSAYLAQADILVSPRTKGENTPMKIYSYLASGKPIVATNLWTHTQVLNEQVSMLTSSTPHAFAEGMLRLAENPALAARLGNAGKALVATRYSHENFSETVTALMHYVSTAI